MGVKETLFEGLHGYNSVVHKLPLCTNSTGEMTTEDVVITEALVDILEENKEPQVCEVLNLLQIYTATFKSYMKLAHERCAAYNVPYTASDIFDFALAWWILGKEQVCRPAYLDDLQDRDKNYFADFAAKVDERLARSEDFFATYQEVSATVTANNPKGIRFRNGDQCISAEDVTLGMALFALKDSTERKQK